MHRGYQFGNTRRERASGAGVEVGDRKNTYFTCDRSCRAGSLLTSRGCRSGYCPSRLWVNLAALSSRETGHFTNVLQSYRRRKVNLSIWPSGRGEPRKLRRRDYVRSIQIYCINGFTVMVQFRESAGRGSGLRLAHMAGSADLLSGLERTDE
jgi:hypothetical protein